MLSLKEFSIAECSTNYALVEVSVDNGFVKQRRLADATLNLAQRIGLASRYYIKNVVVSQQLVPEEISGELLREASVSLFQLTAAETATQLMVEDFTVCRQIEQTEYVDWLFQAKSKFGI
jgi:Rap guanine nucleotide exchange factor 2